MTTRGRERWRWRWRVAAGVGVVAFAVLFAHGIWGLLERRRLTAATAALAAAGEPVTAADLRIGADDPADDDNASLDDRRAAGLIDASLPAWRRYDDLPGGGLVPPLTADERAIAADLCRQQAAALAAVAAGRGKPAGSWHDGFDPTTLLPAPADLGPTRRVSVLLSLAAADAAARGDGPAAVARLADAVGLADAAERRPTLVGHLVAVGMTAVAAEAIERTMPLLTVAAADRPAAVALLAALRDEAAMRAGTQLAWRSERLAVTRILTDMATGRFSVGPTGPATMVPPNAPVLYAVRPLILSDAADYVPYMDGVRRAAAAGDLPAYRARLPTDFRAAMDRHPMWHLAARMLTVGTNKAPEADYRGLAARRLAAVAVAARLFAADHAGRPPTGWPDLVPGYLPAVPVDPMDGRPLRLVDGPPRAYSVGLDERDDGGRPVDESAPVRLRHGDDVAYLVVHPRPSTSPSPPR